MMQFRSFAILLLSYVGITGKEMSPCGILDFQHILSSPCCFLQLPFRSLDRSDCVNPCGMFTICNSLNEVLPTRTNTNLIALFLIEFQRGVPT